MLKKLREASPQLGPTRDVAAGPGRMPGVGLASPQEIPLQGTTSSASPQLKPERTQRAPSQFKDTLLFPLTICSPSTDGAPRGDGMEHVGVVSEV